jgi:hypothetical protein
MKCPKCQHRLTIGDRKCPGCGAPRPALEPAFARAEDAYLRLRHQFDAGSLSADQFQSAIRSQMIDHGGRYWMIGVNSGDWYVDDRGEWREADPPLARATATGRSNIQQGAPRQETKQSGGIPDWFIGLAAFVISGLCWWYIAHHH